MTREHATYTTPSGGMTYDLFTVNGTRFCFPALPPEEDAPAAVYATITGRREQILATAEKIKYRKPARPRRSPRPKPGTGDFAPEAGCPGARIELDDRGTGEVWAIAPHGKLWVACGDTYVLATPSGHEFSALPPGQAPAQIVAAVCKRSAAIVANTVVPASEGRGVQANSPEFTAVLELRERALTWARASLAHQLYPALYPHPGAFSRDAHAEAEPAAA